MGARRRKTPQEQELELLRGVARVLPGRTAGAQAGAEGGHGKDAASETGKYKCRVLGRIVTATLGVCRKSGDQRNRKRNRQDGLLHSQSLFCPGPKARDIESFVRRACLNACKGPNVQGGQLYCLEYVMSEYGAGMASVNRDFAPKVSL